MAHDSDKRCVSTIELFEIEFLALTHLEIGSSADREVWLLDCLHTVHDLGKRYFLKLLQCLIARLVSFAAVYLPYHDPKALGLRREAALFE